MNGNYSYLKLLELEAFLNSESNGDELFIVHNGEKIWPKGKKYFSAKSATIIPINEELKLRNFGSLNLELWEYDTWFSKSRLGKFKILIGEDLATETIFYCGLSDKGKEFSSYALKWMIVHTKS